MKEQTLKDYFIGNVSIDNLSEDLKDSQKKTGFDTTAVYIEAIKDGGKFNIMINHLIQLSDAAINGFLTMNDMNTIAFALITSEYFTWDSESDEGARIETVIFDWDNPEIGYDLTIDNMKFWKDYLITGDYKFDKKLLKRKK